jgi:hypothetical protein
MVFRHSDGLGFPSLELVFPDVDKAKRTHASRKRVKSAFRVLGKFFALCALGGRAITARSRQNGPRWT